VASAKAKLEKSLGGDAFPLDYSTSMRVIRDALAAVSPAPVVVSEGANTMDNARYLPPSPSAIVSAALSLFFVKHYTVLLQPVPVRLLCCPCHSASLPYKVYACYLLA